MDGDFILLLQEPRFHPNSYLTHLTDRFEVTSILHVVKKDELRHFQKPPLFDHKYLVIFEDIRAFEENHVFIRFPTMFPVVLTETRGQLDDTVFFCKEKEIPYRIFYNQFTREDAVNMIQSHAREPVSDAAITAIIRQVGLNPMRIITAMSVCEQLGYTKAVVEKYVDKWIYPNTRQLIECLLGANETAAAARRSIVYLHTNRYWFSHVRRTLLDEIQSLIDIYKDIIEGVITPSSMFEYLTKKRVTRSKVMWAYKLFDHVSIVKLFSLRENLKTISLMELVLELGR